MIFDFEEFAIYDGPGIRTAVFFKGCPLRCVWCHNPEGLSKERELTVKPEQCIDCGKCKTVCSHNPCKACGTCVNECPRHIRNICGYEITVSELSDKLKKNADIYKTVNGGVTISGGEPFYQSVFLFELMNGLKGIHTAVETSGHVSKNIFETSFHFFDLFIMDIKHVDSNVHKNITGVENTVILENLQTLKDSGKPFIIRIPLIPGINDSDENLRGTSELLEGSKNLMRVELLPYNRLTKMKYLFLGRNYNPPFDENKNPNTNQEYFTKKGIESIVL